MVVACMLATGCGGARAFHVTHHHAPWVQRVTTREVAILDDGTDASHGLLARAIAGRLSAVLPTRVMTSADDGRERAILTFALRRSARLDAASPTESHAYTQPLDGRAFTSDSGLSNVTSMTVHYDLDVHLAYARMGSHSFEVSAAAANADAAQADRLAREDLAQLVVERPTSTDDSLSLEVGELESDELARVVDAALGDLSPTRCATIAGMISSATTPSERAQAHFAAGRCEHALAIARSSEGMLDTVVLDRAVAHYEAAAREGRDPRYRAAWAAASRLREELE